MSEKKSERKVVSRTVAIVLGVLCGILVLFLAWAYFSLMSLSDSYTSLQAEYSSYTSSHTHTDSDYNSLQSQYNSLQSGCGSQYTSLQNIVDLAESTVLLSDYTVSQPAGSFIPFTFTADYAGYVSVDVSSSTTTNTWVDVYYSSEGVNYDNPITVGTIGTAVFPVLPGIIRFGVGNHNAINGATETVTVTYHY